MKNYKTIANSYKPTDNYKPIWNEEYLNELKTELEIEKSVNQKLYDENIKLITYQKSLLDVIEERMKLEYGVDMGKLGKVQ